MTIRVVSEANIKAFVDLFFGTVRRECTEHFLFFGSTHLDNFLKTWMGFYRQMRPYQRIENELRFIRLKRTFP